MDRARLNKDVEVLFEQFASTKLPPILNYFKYARKFLYKMYKNKIDIFEIQNDLVTIKFNRIRKPNYIFHKGSEPIKYFAFKNDMSKRGMAIPNPLLYFSFVYNMISIDSMLSKKHTDFVRYVDDFTFFGKDRSKVEEVLEDFDKILRIFSLRRKQEKTKVEKGFPSSSGSNLNELFLNVTFLKGKADLKREDIIELREYLSKLSNEGNIPQIRTSLTMCKKYIDKVYKNCKINQKQSIFIIPMLLKVAYTAPVVTSHVYRLIDIILAKSENKETEAIVDILIDNIDYVDKYFSETDLQIWHYYIISRYAKSTIRSRVLERVIDNVRQQTSTIDSLILSFFIKNNFSENKKVYDLMKKIYAEENGTDFSHRFCMTGIGCSRWWILFIELIKYFRNPSIYQKFMRDPDRRKEFLNYRNDITDYIGTRSSPKYGELGIVFDLAHDIR